MIVVEGLHHINIPATDLAKSVEFYSMFLDFERLEESEKSAKLQFDNLTINLNTEIEAINETYPVFSFILDVDDFTDALQEIESRGIEVASGPTETEKGEKVVIKDPSSNLLELFYVE